MSQIALPLETGANGPSRIVIGNANQAALEAISAASSWPFRTAILAGPPRSGKSLIAKWFQAASDGEAIDDADQLDETELFHRWNRAQEDAAPLLLITTLREAGWQITLPDLASRLSAALHLEIGVPDDTMMAELILLYAEMRRLPLGLDAAAYLAARGERSHVMAERLVETIDRLGMERKAPPGMAICREALELLMGPEEPRLI
ncbi:MAG: ATPase [Novosphingobium sp.]|uniref:ATPase n=1 Tax=Novosphingobium sp. TaxID=1874826 RepID=UPI0032BACA07